MLTKRHNAAHKLITVSCLVSGIMRLQLTECPRFFPESLQVKAGKGHYQFLTLNAPHERPIAEYLHRIAHAVGKVSLKKTNSNCIDESELSMQKQELLKWYVYLLN
jgi:hypothetical protein